MATSFGISAKEVALDQLEASETTWYLHILGNVGAAGEGTIAQIILDTGKNADELIWSDFDGYNIGTNSFTAASFAITFGAASSTGEVTTISQSADVNPITVKASPPATADVAQSYVVTNSATLDATSTVILTSGELTTEVTLSVADQVYKIPSGSIDVSLL